MSFNFLRIDSFLMSSLISSRSTNLCPIFAQAPLRACAFMPR